MITIKSDAIGEDELMEIVLDAGADDLATEGDLFEVTTEPSTFSKVKEALETKGITTESAEVTKGSKHDGKNCRE